MTWKSLISLLLVAALSQVGCAPGYNPELYPINDVLYPGPDVKILGITDDGNIIVSEAFILWVDALKQEIVRLREEIQRLRGYENARPTVNYLNHVPKH